MASINLTDVNNALATVNAAMPLAMTAYNVLKGIWLRMNPGKTEADFVSYLGTASQINIDETTALLIADGYVQTARGVWSKPPTP